ECEFGDLSGVVDREDKVRGVSGRTAGIGQRTFVEQHDVSPAAISEMVDDGVTDDSCADDDDVGSFWQAVHDSSPGALAATRESAISAAALARRSAAAASAARLGFALTTSADASSATAAPVSAMSRGAAEASAMSPGADDAAA